MERKTRRKRQRAEAKRYFRNNNSEFFSTTTWLKLVGAGLGLAIGLGVVYAIFVTVTHLQAAYILGLLGVVIARCLKKVAGTGNMKVAILTIICYVLMIYFSFGFYIAFVRYTSIHYGTILNYVFEPIVWRLALSAIANSGIFTGIIFFIGGAYAYQCALYD